MHHGSTPSAGSPTPERSIDEARPSGAFAAVDLGASSGRVMLGSFRDGDLQLKEVHRFRNSPIVADGVLQWDIERLFTDTLDGIAAAVAESARMGAPLEGIGIDSWGVDFALIDEAGRISGAVSHHRGAGDDAGARSRRGVSSQEVYARTGVLDQAINSSFRLSDLVAAGSATDQRVLFIPDLWAYRLTGAMGTEPTIASTSQLLDPETTDWAPDLIGAYGLDRLRLPAVQRPGTVIGTTTAAITERIGAAAPIAVYRVASHDTASAFAFASPGQRAEGLISSGTWSLVGLCVPEPLRSPRASRDGFTNERGVDGTLLLRNLNGMWVLQECLREWERADGVAPVLDDLVEQAAESPSSARVFDMASPELLRPDDMTARILRLCEAAGRPRPQTRGAIVRAILDSLAAVYAQSLAAAEDLVGHSLEQVRIVGGGSKNALLCQLTADATGLRVIAGPAEASSIGNVVVQIVAASGSSLRGIPDLYRRLGGLDTTIYEPAKATSFVGAHKEIR